ncbi:MAG: hypothetical protein B7Y45_03210, partial [Sphingomonas sp. 28-66-16]
TFTVTVTDATTPVAQSSAQTFQLTVAKGAQTISFTSTAPTAATVGGATYTPTASATSGLAVTLTIDPVSSAVCVLAGGTVSFTAAGTCTINADQPGDGNFNAAPRAQQSVAVAIGAPTVTGLNPAVGTSGGGTTVVIAGSNFAGATSVAFGGVAAASYVVDSATQITAITPPGTGTVDVIVTTPAGPSATTAADRFSYSPPLVASVSPVAIAAGTSAAITITGSGFTPTATVTVGGTAATGVACPTTTQCTATAPALAAGSYDVVVRTGSVASAVSANDRLNYLAPPTISAAFGAASITTATGTTLAITVTNPAANGIALNGTAIAPSALNGLAAIVQSNSCGGALTSSGSVTLSGGVALAPGAQCAIILSVTSTSAGTTSFTPSAAAATGPIALTGVAGAPVTLVVRSTVATLNGLALSTGTLTPGFASATTRYTATVPNATSSITLTPTTSDPGATVTVNGVAVASGTASGAITLAVGANTITTVVTAQDGTSIATYTVIVTRAASSVATLSGLSLSAGPLNPAFASGTTSYTIEVPNTVSSTTVTPTVTDAASTVTVNGTAVGSGIASGAIPLAVGANSITTIVTAQDRSTTASYVVVVTRSEAPPVAADRPGVAIDYNSIGTAIDLSASISGVRTGVAVVTAPAHGSTSIAGEVVTYVPTPGYYGADSFRYTATGPGGTSAPATVGLTVATPAAPVAANKGGVAVAYNSGGTAIDLASSVSGVFTSLAVAGQPTHGSVTLAGTVATYVPTTGYYGADSFTYTATGPGGTSAPATVGVTVATPAAPVAADKNGGTIAYNSGGTAIELAGSVSGVFSSLAVAAPPAHGTVVVTGTVATYTPTAGYYGADSFTYTATGPGGTSPPARVTVTVATPGAPVVADRTGVTIGYNSNGTPIDLATSVSGVYSSLSIAGQPAHGAATLAGTVITYTPTTGYYGPDSFTVTATGPGGTSPAGTVRLTVDTPPPPVAIPVAQTVTLSTTTGTKSADINLSNQVTGVFSTIEISQSPQHGTVLLTSSGTSAAGGVTGTATSQAVAAPIIAVYTPTPGYYGADQFQFVAVGPGGRSAPGSVSLTIVGTRPIARDKQAATGDAQVVLVDLTSDATEAPFTSATIVSVTPAAAATAALIELGPVGNRTYQLSVTPAARFSGTIAVSYSLTNAFATSAPATVTIAVTARPDPSVDPAVRALSDAQAEATRRFAQAQIGNFMRRNEQLHHPSSGRSDPLGFRFNSRDGSSGFGDARFYNGDLDITERMRWASDGRSGGIDSLTNPDAPGGGGRGGGRRGGVPRGPGEGTYGAGATTGNSPGFGAAEGGSGGRSIGGLAIWTGGAIEIGTRDATSRRTKITASTSGLSGGIDMRIGEDVTVGVGGGYGADLSEIDGGAGRVRSDTSVVAAYGSAVPIDGFFLDGVIGYGTLRFNTRRLVGNALATGGRDGSMWFGALSAGIDRNNGPLLWSVYGHLEWLDATLGSYAETGAGRLNLRFDERNVSSLSSVIGGRLGFTQKVSFGSVSPQIRGEWQHEFNGSSLQGVDYADIIGASQYGIETIGWRRDSFTVSLGSRLILPYEWALDFELGLRGATGQTSGQLRIAVTKKF